MVIAFDIGDKRIGVAATDPLGMMALPLETYFRKNTAEDVKYLVSLAKSRCADVIVCGLPLNFDGSESEQTKKTRRFIDLLRAETDIPVVTEDERFKSVLDSDHHQFHLDYIEFCPENVYNSTTYIEDMF